LLSNVAVACGTDSQSATNVRLVVVVNGKLTWKPNNVQAIKVKPALVGDPGLNTVTDPCPD
jgi:hypothetical protein